MAFEFGDLGLELVAGGADVAPDRLLGLDDHVVGLVAGLGDDGFALGLGVFDLFLGSPCGHGDRPLHGLVGVLLFGGERSGPAHLFLGGLDPALRLTNPLLHLANGGADASQKGVDLVLVVCAATLGELDVAEELWGQFHEAMLLNGGDRWVSR